jgi:hypothetical protein
MHVIQAVTAGHERHLETPPNPRHSTAEVFHWSQAVHLFNEKLCKKIELSDRDPLWATAALVGIMSSSNIEAATPEEAWPLKKSEPYDLDWLRMSEGKAAIWEITDPLRPDSVFRDLRRELGDNFVPVGHYESAMIGTEGIPQIFVDLFDFKRSSNSASNPYYTAVRVILALVKMGECTEANVVKRLGFIGSMRPAYKILLHQKDPRAMLLLAYWFAHICNSVWWMQRRAIMEGSAICLYLDRHCAHNALLHRALLLPKIGLGLLNSNDVLEGTKEWLTQIDASFSPLPLRYL